MRSWGKLPMNYIEQWKGRRCDLVFTTKRMGLRPISFCPDLNNSSTVTLGKFKCQMKVYAVTQISVRFGASVLLHLFSTFRLFLFLCPLFSFNFPQNNTDKKKNKAPVHSNQVPSLPLIAVMAATTTRKVSKPSTKNLSLFMYLLPSLIRTLDCGFRYEYVLGYDKGDPFYDSAEVRYTFAVFVLC